MTLAGTTFAHPLAHYRQEFPIFERKIYLNSCSLGALSQRSRAQLDRFLDEWDAQGAAAWYDAWLERLADLRQGYAAVIGAKESEIALHASVSTATAVLGSALDYRSRPKVVTTSLDFPTVVYQWLAKEPAGVELVVVQSPDGVTVPVDLIAAAIDERTALVATSHVYFTTGAIQDIRALTEAAHAKGALCFIDAYQSVGQIPVDVHATGVDFLCAGGLKWLLGGTGITFMYVREDRITSFEPTVTGWFANARQLEFDVSALDWHESARRFEMGTPSLSAVHTQLGGLELIREIGVPAIREVVSDLVEDLVDRARAAGRPARTAATPDQRSAIVTIPSPDPQRDVARLAEREIVADARPGHVRISPFFYNTVEDHAAALDVLRS